MGAVLSEILVLRTYPYSDTSRIVRALSADLGLVSLIARGVRKQMGRRFALLEPFVTGEATIYPSRRGDLHTLGAFSATRARQSIGRNLGGFAGASLLVEGVLRMATPEPSHTLFRIVQRALDALALPEVDALPVVIGAGWQMLAVLGFAPETERCTRCARELAEAEDVTFDLPGGGAACLSCRPGRRIIGSEVRHVVRTHGHDPAAQEPGLPVPVSARAEYRDLFLGYMAERIDDPAHPLRSLPLVTASLQ